MYIFAVFALHHQIVRCTPLAEGNSIYLSVSPAWDVSRAPLGMRTLTISSHTDHAPWWDLYFEDRTAYTKRKETYVQRMLDAAEVAMPGMREAIHLQLSGTPDTFERFTRRAWGWVGGFPQTQLLGTWAPRIAPRLWMVGDSIFPGQSTAAVALGGLRVAEAVLKELGQPLPNLQEGDAATHVRAGKTVCIENWTA